MLQGLGKLIVAVGAALVIAGAVLWLGGRLGLGSLPGDFRFTSERWGCYLPIGTSILLSLLLTLLLNLFFRLFR